MKKLFILLLTVGLGACSSGGGGSSNNNGGGGGQVTEFGQKMSGTWVSECSQNEQGNYKETLLINADGSGQSTMNYYANGACSGNAVKTDGPNAFTYAVQDLGNGTAQLTLTIQGQTAQIEVTILNNVMDARGQNGKARYTRINQGQTTPTGNDFDRLAMGIWITEQCYPYQNNTSARQQLTINGNGSASTVVQVYQSQDCSGRSRSDRPVQANYRVDHFANGQGQISVNNEPADVMFQNNRMTITDANGTTVYSKVN